MKLDGYTRLAAVVANPIKHSISPFIHNRAFEATDMSLSTSSMPSEKA